MKKKTIETTKNVKEQKKQKKNQWNIKDYFLKSNENHQPRNIAKEHSI